MIREALGEMFTAAQKDLREKNLRADEIVVTQGDAVDCILAEADARQVDLIVMGYHPRGRLEEAIVGSVSRSVLRRRTSPLVMCTAQRPQRPCPPHGWAISTPDACAASVSSVPVGTCAG